MATLYLHIGTSKTGSTAIQHFCEENGAALARRGYCYPLLPYKYKEMALRRNAHFLVAPDQREDGSFEREREERVWRRRVARLAKYFRKYPNVVLSDEAIWNRTEFECRGFWRNLKREADARGFDVRIIVYLRRQDQFAGSQWAQLVKKTFADRIAKLRWEEALARTDEWIALDYYRHLEEIAAHFGRENIDVRVYDRQRFPGCNIMADFLEALGLRAEADFVMPTGNENPSLGGDALEIKRRINNMPDLTPAQLKQARRVAEACYAIERKQRTYSMFTDAELAAFLKKYERSNRLVARDYLGSEAQLFADPAPQPPKWTPENPHMEESIERFRQLAANYRADTRPAWTARFVKRNIRRALRAVKRR